MGGACVECGAVGGVCVACGAVSGVCVGGEGVGGALWGRSYGPSLWGCGRGLSGAPEAPAELSEAPGSTSASDLRHC